MLINRTAVREFILEQIRLKRDFLHITQVSGAALDEYEGALRARIVRDVMQHPTRGKTFVLEEGAVLNGK